MKRKPAIGRRWGLCTGPPCRQHLCCDLANNTCAKGTCEDEDQFGFGKASSGGLGRALSFVLSHLAMWLTDGGQPETSGCPLMQWLMFEWRSKRSPARNHCQFESSGGPLTTMARSSQSSGGPLLLRTISTYRCIALGTRGPDEDARWLCSVRILPIVRRLSRVPGYREAGRLLQVSQLPF